MTTTEFSFFSTELSEAVRQAASGVGGYIVAHRQDGSALDIVLVPSKSQHGAESAQIVARRTAIQYVMFAEGLELFESTPVHSFPEGQAVYLEGRNLVNFRASLSHGRNDPLLEHGIPAAGCIYFALANESEFNFVTARLALHLSVALARWTECPRGVRCELPHVWALARDFIGDTPLFEALALDFEKRATRLALKPSSDLPMVPEYLSAAAHSMLPLKLFASGV